MIDTIGEIWFIVAFILFLFADEPWYNIVLWPLAATIKVIKHKE